ncbi:MAG: hypothetical protein F6K47_32735 [Symploca sp. SIO2E6]|nr:hypothetical protein [Symploca sp. SIO2E6]
MGNTIYVRTLSHYRTIAKEDTSFIFNPRLQNIGTVKSAKTKVEEKLKGLNINYKVHSLNNYVEIDNAAEAGLPVVLYRPGSKFAKTFNETVTSSSVIC